VGARPVVDVDSRLVPSAAAGTSPEYIRVGRGALKGCLEVLRVEKRGSMARTWWRLAVFTMHGAACTAADACIVIFNKLRMQIYMQIARIDSSLNRFK
jgi:hypothetical protein